MNLWPLILVLRHKTLRKDFDGITFFTHSRYDAIRGIEQKHRWFHWLMRSLLRQGRPTNTKGTKKALICRAEKIDLGMILSYDDKYGNRAAPSEIANVL